jgi:hypothetical protein
MIICVIACNFCNWKEPIYNYVGLVVMFCLRPCQAWYIILSIYCVIYNDGLEFDLSKFFWVGNNTSTNLKFWHWKTINNFIFHNISLQKVEWKCYSEQSKLTTQLA